MITIPRPRTTTSTSAKALLCLIGFALFAAPSFAQPQEKGETTRKQNVAPTPQLEVRASDKASLIPEGTDSIEQPQPTKESGISPEAVTVTSYPFTSAAGVALEDMSSGTTLLLAADQDDAASALAPIGFDFWFDGVRQTIFSANANGLMKLGPVAVTTAFSNGITTTTNQPNICPYWDDLWLGSNGKIHYKVIGSAPNRKLVVEWQNEQVPRVATATTGAGTFQAWLYESSGKIEFVYGTGMAANVANSGYTVGIASGAASFAAVSTAGPTVSYAAANDSQTGAIAAGAKYTFTPNVPADPTGLSYTAVGLNSMTLNWTDNSSNEFGFAIYRSLDGTSYEFVGQTAANATSSIQTGLASNTTYFWRVFAVSEGSVSNAASGSQASNTGTVSGTKSVGPTGFYASLGAAFTDINTNGLAGHVILELQAAYVSTVETFPLAVATLGSPSNTITIRPETGAAALSINGLVAAQTLNLNGATNVTIDGRAGGAGASQLTISNTSTTGLAVQLINGASRNTIKFCTITGVNTSATGAVVLFSTSTGATGNNNNTIDTCDVKDGATTPVNGILSLGTAGTALLNTGNTVSNSNISNYHSATVPATGINVNSNSSNWTILSNRFFQTATRASTAAITHRGILVSFGFDHTISGNVVGFANSGGTGTYTMTSNAATGFVGIQLAGGATSTSSIQGNTVAGISHGTTSGAFTGISVTAGSANVGTVTGNTVGSGTGNGSITQTSTVNAAFIVGMNASGTALTTVVMSNNIIGSLTSTGSPATINPNQNTVQLLGGDITFSNNTIGSTATANSIQTTTAGTSATAQQLLPIFAGSTMPMTISNNTVANITNAGTGTAHVVRGIQVQSPGISATASLGKPSIVANTVRDITGSNANTSPGATNGIFVSTGTGGAPFGGLIDRNTVFAIKATNAGTVATGPIGIVLTGASTTVGVTGGVVSQNKVYDIRNASTGVTATTPPLAVGIWAQTATTFAQVVNNMVSLGNAQTTNTEFIGIWNNFNTTATVRSWFNSVHIEGTAASGALPSYGFLRGDNGAASAITAPVDIKNSIFNNTRTGGTGKHYAIGNVNSVPATGWSATASNNNVLNSAVSTTIGNWGLGVDRTIAQWKSSSGGDGLSLSGVSVVFVDAPNGDLHANFGVTATAIESGGTAIAGLTVDYDMQTRPGPAGSVNGGASAPDIGADEFDGVPLDIAAPAISYTPFAGTTSTSNRILTATITDFTGVDSGANLPRIYFKKSTDVSYVSTQCSLTGGTAQNGTYSCTVDYSLVGGGTVTGNDIIQYFVVAQDTVGNLGSNPAGATGANVNSIAFGGTPNSYTILPTISGTFTVGSGGNYPSLTGVGGAITALNNSVITGPVVFNLIENASAPQAIETYPITINANSGSSATNTVTIKPNGAGTTMTGSSASALMVLNGADYVIIDGSSNGTSSRDLTITNSNTGTSSAVVWMQTNVADGATNNVVKNVNVVGSGNTQTLFGVGSGSSTIGITSTGTGNNNNTFQNCNVSKTQYGIFSQGASLASKNTGTVITGNLMNTVSPNNIGKGGILVGFENGVQIIGNAVSAISTGVSSFDAFGISLGLSADQVGPAAFTGNEVTNAIVSKNSIGSVAHTATYSATGIAIASAASGTTLVSNNYISGVTANSTSGDLAAGIFAGGGAGSTTQIYANSISMTGDRGTGTSLPSYALAIGGSNPTVDARDNILFNTQTTAGTGKSYAIGLAYSTYTALTSDFNDLFVSGTNTFIGQTGGLGTTGTDRSPLTGVGSWSATTGKDANSVSANPVFVSTSNLHLSAGTSPAANVGTPIGAVTVDFDGDARSVIKPDIGADEIASNDLSALSLSMGSLTPAFAPATISYTASVSNSVTDITVTPTVADSNATVTVNGNAVTSGTPSSSITLNVGNNTITVVVTPEFGPFAADQPDAGTAKTYTITVNRAAPTIYTLTYTAGTGGSITGTSPQMVQQGNDGTAVTAVPDAGYNFVSWSDGVLTASRTDLNVMGDITVSASFAINTYTLTYTAGANGTINGTTPQTVNYGANGTAVTAVPDTGYSFVSWSDGVLTATRTDMNVMANITVSASFAINTYTLTYTAGANGTISGTSPQTVNYGANGSAVTAVPDAGYAFVDWSDASTQNPRTDTNVMANISVTANFAAADVSVNGGNLLIQDTTGANNDNLTITLNGANIRISDPSRSIGAGPGATQVDANTIDVPLASITGTLTFNSLGGNDTLTLNFANGTFIPAGGLFYNGGTQTGTPGDKLVISGNGQGLVTYNYTNAHDGSVVMSNFGTVNYTGLEPITNTGTATDIIFNLPVDTGPEGPNDATLADANFGLNARLSGATFETTDFVSPSGSVQINRGNVSDTMTVDFLSALASSLSFGAPATPFSTVTFTGSLELTAADKNLIVYASDTISLSSTASDLVVSGTGQISLTTARNISFVSGSSLNTVDGAITLMANQQGSPTGGTFAGVNLIGATVQATGTGIVTVNGKGGTIGAGNSGVFMNSSAVIKGGTTPGVMTTDVLGTGGTGGSNPHGVDIENSSSVTSFGGDVRVRGFSGAGTGASNYGVIPVSGGTIRSGGNGNVVVAGTGGSNAAGGNVGVIPHQGAGTITSGGTGTVSVTGTGGNGPNSHGVQLFRDGRITSGGAGNVMVNGTAGGTNGFGVYVNGTDNTARINSGGGTITVTGTPISGGLGIVLGGGGTNTISSVSNGAITLISDTMTLDGTGVSTINSGTGATTIRQTTNGKIIDLGGADSGTQLGLTNLELNKVTSGTLVIGDANTGNVNVSAGIAQSGKVTNIFTSTSATVLNGGSLGIRGTVNSPLNVNGGGTLAPGTSPGVINSGNVLFAATGVFAVEIGGTTPGSAANNHDQLNVTGTVNLGGATLTLASFGGFTPLPSQTFTIVNNDDVDAITGTFSGLAEGATISNFLGSGLSAQITYAGGTGNDVVITVNEAPPSGLTYSDNPATYTVGVTVTPNTPSSGGGAVVSYSVSPALPAGLILDTTTGVISGIPTAITPTATYTVTAMNGGGSTSVGVVITVNDVAPSGLTYSDNPATYTVGVPITPNMPSSSGGAVVSYAVSPALPAGLTLDTTTGVISGPPTTPTAMATYTVTAMNSGGSTSVGVDITVVAAASSNADLSDLTLSSGTLAPPFASGTTTYTASVSNATNSITVTPTSAGAGATIEVRVNGGSYVVVASGSPSGLLALNVGANTVDLRVTAADLTTVKIYTITVTRAGPVTTNGGSGLAPDYASLAAAITALNAATMTDPVIITLTGNETAPAGGYAITQAGGTSTNTITIQGSSSTITASGALTVGALNDAIFKLIGADWITIQSFTMQENPANTVNTPAASNNMTEWGVAFLYATTTNGAQNNTIQTNTISLNRTYLNTFGIYSNTRHSATAVTTTAEVTAASGSNSNNKVYTNAISNVNYGIVFIGAGTTIAAIDSGNDVGGSSAATGNTITNWGGGAALSSYVSLTGSNYCIFDNQQINDNVSFNTITSAALTQSVTAGGFLKNYSVAQPTGTITTTINNNTVQVTNNTTGTTTGSIIGINNQGLSPMLATATMSVNNNVVQNSVLGGATATSAGLTAITNLSAPGTMNMTGNTVVNNAITATSSTTGTLVGISNSGAAGTLNITNNVVRSMSSRASTTGQMQGIANSGAVVTAINLNNNQLGNATSGYFSSPIASAGPLFGIVNAGGANATAVLSIQNNDIRGITYSITASSSQLYYNNQVFTGSTNISGNTITNITVNTTGSVTMISNSVSHLAGTTHNVNNNSIVTGYSKTGAGGTIVFYDAFGSSPATVTETNTGNNFSNMTFTGAAAIIGWRSADGTTPGSRKTVTNNTFSNIAGGTGAISSILYVGFSDNTFANNNVSGNTISNVTNGNSITAIFSDGQNQNFFNNTVSGLSATGTGAVVNGISLTGATTQNIFKNKIYDLQSNNATGAVNGIATSAGATVNVYNNLIGDLRTPATSAANPLIGLNITGGTTVNAYYNSIYLNGTSTGANFGSSAVSASTTPTVALRNNVLVNTSTPNGTGLTVAHRRSSATLTTYGSTSNNNDFYAGTPSASQLIFNDGTNSDQTIAAYKGRVAMRDSMSFTENPPFLSTSGASASFLHLDPTVATHLESGAVNIAGITDDFDGDIRQGNSGYAGSGTAPDVGADEFNGTALAYDTSLSNLTVSAGTLMPAFAPATTSYTVSVPNGTTSIMVTPTAADVNSTITVNGTPVASGTPSGAIPLVVGSNVITIVVTAPDGAMTTYTVTVTRAPANTAPTITAASGVTRQQGSPASNSDIATVNDAESGAGAVVVTVTSANPSNGVTISNIVNTAGTVTADVVADCTATNATFTLQASDGSLTATDTLTVTVTPDTAPTLSYNNASVALNGATTVNPVTGPTDNGSVSTIVVQSQGTYTGTISVDNTTGVVSISNAAPSGVHTITIRATDNCGLTTDATFTLTVNAPTSITVTPAVTPTASDNDYTRINDAVQTIASGGVITLSGAFDWTEPFAAASWATGSDYTPGTLDDYSILVPDGLSGVTFTASSLGAASIQGPGDLPQLDLEGVFFFDGGTNTNWTISNIRFLDFDITIGMAYEPAGTNNFSGTQIVNNFIRMARDLDGPTDTFQNIAILYSFGTNQLISGNTIEIPGDGVGANAAEVAMQSNSGGALSYDGLQITNNTIRVLNAQSATPEFILGIWENGNSHSSNITISGNAFVNQGAGNDPALNAQLGFEITSHSSATSTVLYANNTVSGANQAFEWYPFLSYGTYLPVQLTNNTMTGNAKGVLVQSQGQATLTNNTITGIGATGTGVRAIDGLTTVDLIGTTISGTGTAVSMDATNSGTDPVTMRITNSTLSGNTAATGGALTSTGTNGNAAVTITNSTLTGNSPSGHQITLQDASLTVGNSIFNTKPPGANISASGTSLVTSLGYNLSSDNFQGFLTAAGDQTNKDAILGPLKNNGGPTFTHAPLTGSPAIDQGKDFGPVGPAYTATGVDQRGFTRPMTYNDPSILPPAGGDRSDIGAVELAPGVQPVSAVSRLVHGALGTFDIPLSLSGPVEIECRSGGGAGDYQLVLTFASPVTHGTAAVTSGVGVVTSVTAPAVEGVGSTQVTINLSGVGNLQRLTVALSDVSDGANMGDVGVRVGLVLGDTTGNGAVGSSDVSQAKTQSGQPVTNSNFRNDVNVNGAISASDIGLIKSQSGQTLPPVPAEPDREK